jgi:hypothetical protein
MSDVDVSRVFARLRAEVQARPASGETSDQGSAEPPRLAWRLTAERFATVTGDLPYMHRPGAFGRIRGLLLVPIKFVLRKLMRWYVEPIAVQQREFNAAVLHALDELTEWTAEQVARLERSSSEQ